MRLSALVSSLDLIDSAHTNHLIQTLGDPDITGIAYDSRKVKPGNLFVAIRGTVDDGHDHLEDAAARGASVAIVESREATSSLPHIPVLSSRLALSHMADLWYGHPSRELTVFAVTGSNGKTSSTLMLDTILRHVGLTPGVIGSVKHVYGQHHDTAILTTPESLELHGMFRAQRDAGCDVTVMEASSIAATHRRVADVDFDVMAMTNLSREHIDQHGSFDAYLDAKWSLLQGLKPSAIAILNADDPRVMARVDTVSARIVTFAIASAQADVCARDVTLDHKGSTFTLIITRPFATLVGEVTPGAWPVTLPQPGLTNVANALTAITMALTYGVSVHDAIAALATYRAAERRCELIFDGPFKIYDDHFMNPGNINAVMTFLKTVPMKHLHILLTVRGGRGPIINRENGLALGAWKDTLPWGRMIVTSYVDSPTYNEDVQAGELEAYLGAVRESGFDPIVNPSAWASLTEVVDAAEAGDVVLLAGTAGIDKGARFVLNHLLDRHPEWDREAILKRIEGRYFG